MTESPVSIIVPVLDEAAGIKSFLLSLQCLRDCGHEVILVDGGSNDDTLQLAEGLFDQLLHTRAGRAVQMNAGAAAASHAILLFLHADTFLPQQAIAEIADALISARWGRFDIRLTGIHPLLPVIAWSMNLRSRLTGIATGDQAIFVSRPVFEAMGGFPAIPLMEDLALSEHLRLESAPACLKSRVSSSGRRWLNQGVLRTIWTMWCLRLKWFLGRTPEELVKHYYPHYRNETRYVFDQALVQLFARAPLTGQVKTRLAATIGDEAACQVYTSLLFRQLGWLQGSRLCAAELWVAGDSQALPFQASRLVIHNQHEGDLGERMAKALKDGLNRYEKVLVIGCDCPAIDSALIESAISELDSHDVVLAPASDGGYVLVGMKKYLPGLFTNMPWSTSAVMGETIRRLQDSGHTFALLPEQLDIDDEASLKSALANGWCISGVS